jgi:phage shock protein A
MTEKQSIFGRIQQLTRANINAMLDRAEDPQKMLDQLVRDYTNNIAAAEQAIAQTIGNLRMAEADLANDQKVAAEWGSKAQAAVRAAAQYRESGDMTNATKFDELARVALKKQIDVESQIAASKPMVETQQQQVAQLKSGLVQMKDKLGDLRSRRDSLIARARTAQAMAQVTAAASKINILDPTSELGRYEDAVRRQEAMARGQIEIAQTSMQDQWAELESSKHDSEVEARMAQLLSGGSSSTPAAIEQ